jgi:hypothetical protein
MAGIKETKEMIVGVNEVGIAMINVFKDGIQFKDFGELWDKFKDDAEFKAKVEAAYDNFKAIPEEIKDVDINEGMELAIIQLGYIPKMAAALGKKVNVDLVHPIGEGK